MPTNYSSRFTTIGIALVLSILLIFRHPGRLTDPSLTFIQKTELKPGIDMVGGVSLIYQIQPAAGTHVDRLAEKVMEALKRRVDPNGLRNLVWRPQGNDRLEIQMPLSPEAAKADVIRGAFSKAQQALDATNILSDKAIDAVEHLQGQQRAATLKAMAMDSQARGDLFDQMVQTFDQIQALRANPQKMPLEILATKLQPLMAAYDAQKAKIDQTNLASDNFEQILEQANSEQSDQKDVGQAKIGDLKIRFAQFPSRLAAMKQMEDQFADYDAVKLAVTDSNNLKRLLQGSGVLEFHILADNISLASSPSDLAAMKARMEPDGKGPLPQPGDTIRWMEVEKVTEFDQPGFAPQTMEWNGKHYVPVLVTPNASMDKSSSIDGKPWGLENAVAISPQGATVVQFEFDTVGAKLFGDMTSYWYNYARRLGGSLQDARVKLAIVLDNKIISAPNLNAAITGGSGIIEGGGQGGFSQEDASYLINTLNAGSLPAQLSSEPISEQQVGPTLGADNLHKGLVACGFGLIVVAVFLVSYYYVAGFVAFLAVCMNLALILGTMAALGATFTLPSIAGIVLTIGTAVDANVLIFERLREEQHKGLPLKMALRNSYNTARSAIIDSNMTSIITSVFLYVCGSEEVKGFGLTLIIGILASLFTALYVTKTIYAVLIDKFGVRHLGSLPLTFPKWDRMLRPDWDWMDKAKYFYTFSIIAISIGMVMFIAKVRDHRMMDIEFSSGTSVQFELKQPMAQEDVRKLIDDASDKQPLVLPSPSVVAVGTDSLHYEVVTPNENRPAVKAVILETMQSLLKIQLASQFDDWKSTAADARGKTVLPIADANFSVDGYFPPAAKEHVGGVAIVLRNISPALSPDQVKLRLVNERVSSTGEESGGLEFLVNAPTPSNQPTNFMVIVGSNPSVLYNADAAKWFDDLAQPLWKLTTNSITSPPSLEKESNFDAQVAGEMRQDAFFALTFSIIAIMIYIWVRFGNLKFGTATVVALLHDTVFTLAALGFAHYISDHWHKNFLQVEPFRINLTVVAGILTIMGYSMIDTIVVFDRIRENRGKYGHLDKQVINDAINQTLSRTLLTAGTTIVTVSFMYFMGGEGIHGFTFVLLIGILVGTYSSVAIAAPLLLVGKDKPRGIARPSYRQLQPATR